MNRLRWEIFTPPFSEGMVSQTTPQPLPEPWLTFCHVRCRTKQTRESDIQLLTGRLAASNLIVCSVWICLPDMSVLPSWACSALLMHVQVHASYRGQGIGVELLENAIAIAGEKGCNSVVAITSDRKLAKHFYGKAGFCSTTLDCLLSTGSILCSHGLSPENEVETRWQELTVSAGDIATIQSACRHPHLKIEEGKVELVSAEEVEEDYCYAHSIERNSIRYCGATIIWCYENKRGVVVRVIKLA